MPTANRRNFVPRAIRLFLAQDYPERELVILDDGQDSAADLIPDDPRIRYVRLPTRCSVGVKRNLCIQHAHGDLIMHWDDDDWMAPHRIRYQTEALLAAGAEVCGLRRMLFYRPATGDTWLYDYPMPNFLVGGSLLYTRTFWRLKPFADLKAGEDTRFIQGRCNGKSLCLQDHTFYVATIHPGNTSPKVTTGGYWKRWPGDIRTIMGEDVDTCPVPVKENTIFTRENMPSAVRKARLPTQSTERAASAPTRVRSAELSNMIWFKRRDPRYWRAFLQDRVGRSSGASPPKPR